MLISKKKHKQRIKSFQNSEDKLLLQIKELKEDNMKKSIHIQKQSQEIETLKKMDINELVEYCVSSVLKEE